jgi:hypothetical protein
MQKDSKTVIWEFIFGDNIKKFSEEINSLSKLYHFAKQKFEPECISTLNSQTMLSTMVLFYLNHIDEPCEIHTEEHFRNIYRHKADIPGEFLIKIKISYQYSCVLFSSSDLEIFSSSIRSSSISKEKSEMEISLIRKVFNDIEYVKSVQFCQSKNQSLSSHPKYDKDSFFPSQVVSKIPENGLLNKDEVQYNNFYEVLVNSFKEEVRKSLKEELRSSFKEESEKFRESCVLPLVSVNNSRSYNNSHILSSIKSKNNDTVEYLSNNNFYYLKFQPIRNKKKFVMKINQKMEINIKLENEFVEVLDSVNLEAQFIDEHQSSIVEVLCPKIQHLPLNSTTECKILLGAQKLGTCSFKIIPKGQEVFNFNNLWFYINVVGDDEIMDYENAKNLFEKNINTNIIENTQKQELLKLYRFLIGFKEPVLHLQTISEIFAQENYNFDRFETKYYKLRFPTSND